MNKKQQTVASEGNTPRLAYQGRSISDEKRDELMSQVLTRECPVCGNERRLYQEGWECAACNLKP